MRIRIADRYRIKPSEITPERICRDRRRLIARSGLVMTGFLAGCKESRRTSVDLAETAGSGLADLKFAKLTDMALGENRTAYADIPHYNNYYEFGTQKGDLADKAGTLRTRPWSVSVEGECEAPAVIELDELLRPQILEERVYRHRCVEAWSPELKGGWRSGLVGV